MGSRIWLGQGSNGESSLHSKLGRQAAHRTVTLCACCLTSPALPLVRLALPLPLPLLQKDTKRLERLQHNAEFTGGSIIDAQQADFLALDPEAPQYQAVRAVLLDPSCSGSGTSFSRMDYLLPSSADRLKGGLGLGLCLVCLRVQSCWKLLPDILPCYY